MYPLINKPTRITLDFATLIDNIFPNNLNANLKNGVLISNVLDHLLIFCGTLNGKSVESYFMKKEKYNLNREVNSVNVKKPCEKAGIC